MTLRFDRILFFPLFLFLRLPLKVFNLGSKTDGPGENPQNGGCSPDLGAPPLEREPHRCGGGCHPSADQIKRARFGIPSRHLIMSKK